MSTPVFRAHLANRGAPLQPLLQAPRCKEAKPTLSCAPSAFLLQGLTSTVPQSFQDYIQVKIWMDICLILYSIVLRL